MGAFFAWAQRITGGAPGRLFLGGGTLLLFVLLLIAAGILWALGWPGWRTG